MLICAKKVYSGTFISPHEPSQRSASTCLGFWCIHNAAKISDWFGALSWSGVVRCSFLLISAFTSTKAAVIRRLHQTTVSVYVHTHVHRGESMYWTQCVWQTPSDEFWAFIWSLSCRRSKNQLRKSLVCKMWRCSARDHLVLIAFLHMKFDFAGMKLWVCSEFQRWIFDLGWSRLLTSAVAQTWTLRFRDC